MLTIFIKDLMNPLKFLKDVLGDELYGKIWKTICCIICTIICGYLGFLISVNWFSLKLSGAWL